jgi:hypothetical protein
VHMDRAVSDTNLSDPLREGVPMIADEWALPSAPVCIDFCIRLTELQAQLWSEKADAVPPVHRGGSTDTNNPEQQQQRS